MSVRPTKYTGVILGAILLSWNVSAQNAEKGIPSQTLSAAWAPVKVEHHIGIRGGYGMGTVRFEPIRQTKFLMGMMVGGISYKFDVPKQKYVGTIEANINWSQKGYKVHRQYGSEEVYERKYNVIEIPIVWQPYLPLSKGGSRFFISAGPFLSYAFNSTEKDYNAVTGQIFKEGKYEYDPIRDNRWGYGITFGAGFLIAVKRFSISLEGRYNIALSDTFKGVNKYEGNPFRSPVDQINICLGLNYKIKQQK